MEKITTDAGHSKFYYKSYDLPNKITFSRNLTNDKAVFEFGYEPAENIGIGIGLTCVYNSDNDTILSNLEEIFSSDNGGKYYLDAFGDKYYADEYGRFNGLYYTEDVPAVVSTVYPEYTSMRLTNFLTDGNITRCFNAAGYLILIIALNRQNLFIVRGEKIRLP